MRLKNCFCCFLLIGALTTLRPNAEVVSWLKGTYTSFESGSLAKHKGLSPLMGAIAWHSGWIAGLYTWGTGDKEVVIALPVAGDVGRAEPAALAQALAARVKYKWVNEDKTTELVRALFYDVAGDIQPTLSKTNPFFIAITDQKDDAKKLDWLLNQIATGEIPKKMSEFKIRGASKFLELIRDSRAECGEGKTYPAYVTDQILAAYYYAVQFKICGAEPVATFVPQAIERYMHALGFAEYKPEQYSVDFLKTDECSRVIDEAALVKQLYQKLLPDADVPPLANYIHFDYRGASDRGTCVDTMIFNFFNVMLYDAANKRYTLDLLPEATRTHVSSALKSFYENVENANVANTTKIETMNAWLEVISGLPDAIQKDTPAYTQEAAHDHIVYLSKNQYTYHDVTKEGLFELDSTPDNVRLVISYLLGLLEPVKSFEDLSPLLSTEKRKIDVSPLLDQIFQVSINGKPVVEFHITVGHSYAELVNLCKQKSGLACVDSPLCLPYWLLTRQYEGASLQELRYLLYGAGVNDYDWLINVFNSICADCAENADFAALARKIWIASSGVFSFLDLNYLATIGTPKDEWWGSLLPRAMRDHNSVIVDKLLAQENIDVNVKDIFGDTALILAIKEKMPDVALKLLDKPGIDVNAKGKRSYDQTALVVAIYENMPDVVRKLLKKHADISRDTLSSVRGNQNMLQIFREEGVVAV